MSTRLALGGVGVAAAMYGAYLVLSRGFDSILAVAIWLASAVILHDFVLVPIVLALCFAGRRFLPQYGQRPALLALIVFGSLTVVAVPVLGRFGARPDNPTLLDRPYVATWLVLLVVTLVVVVLAARRRRPAGSEPSDA